MKKRFEEIRFPRLRKTSKFGGMRRSSGIFDGSGSLEIDFDHQELLERELKLANGVIRDAPLVKLIFKWCMFQTEQSDEYLLHHRRRGRDPCGCGLSRTACLKTPVGLLFAPIRRHDMRFACMMMSVGMGAAPLCFWAGVSLYGANAAPGFENRAPAWAMVVRERKGDRLISPVEAAADAPETADSAFASVDVAGRFESAITIRDQNGRLLYSANAASQTTVIAKRAITRGRALPMENREPTDSKRAASPPRKMPDGCEGAFSPYAAPRMAHIIGRCISGIGGNIHVAAVAS
jgi:hypothetical protein